MMIDEDNDNYDNVDDEYNDDGTTVIIAMMIIIIITLTTAVVMTTTTTTTTTTTKTTTTVMIIMTTPRFIINDRIRLGLDEVSLRSIAALAPSISCCGYLTERCVCGREIIRHRRRRFQLIESKKIKEKMLSSSDPRR